MCEFVSWIEYEDQILFLTDADLNTKRGRELKDYLGEKYMDISGHGAIRFYYEIGDKGHNRECSDFSDPDEFPPAIIEAIKKGKFSKIAMPENPLQLIKAQAWAKYKKIQIPAWAKYEKIKAPAWAKYKKIKAQVFWSLMRNKKNRAKNWR